MYTYADAHRGQKWTLEPLDLKLQMVVSWLTGMLQTELVPYGRTATILNNSIPQVLIYYTNVLQPLQQSHNKLCIFTHMLHLYRISSFTCLKTLGVYITCNTIAMQSYIYIRNLKAVRLP